MCRNSREHPIYHYCLKQTFQEVVIYSVFSRTGGADLLALYTIIISYSYEETLGVNLKANSALYCKLHLFLTALFSGVSIWLIVILALERTFVVYFPFKAKSVCKPKKAFIVTTLLVTFLMAFNSHYIYGMQIQVGISENGDSIKLNASTTFGRKENASLLSLTEAVSDSLNNSSSSNNNKDDDDKVNNNYDNHDEGANIDEMIGRSTRKEITTNKPKVMGQEHNATDHPLAIVWNSSEITSGNHSISAPECRGIFNKTSVNLTGNCIPVECNGSHLGDVTSTTTCNSSELKSIGNQSQSLQSNVCNSSDLQNDESTPLVPSVFKEKCMITNRIEEDSLIKSGDLNNTKSTPIPRNQDNGNVITNFCGFVDESYTNFYRSWGLSSENILYYWVPVLIIVTANTATWIKVYRSSSESLSSTAALTLRRTRHVLVLTSLISVGFIVFITPISVIYLTEAFLAEDFTYPLYNREAWATFQFIGESVYLCNHSFNFFLYILSGKRFRNSLKAAFCKPTSQM